MDTKNLVSTRCASCDGNGLPESLRPYCSVVCRILGQAGLGWRPNPYQIVDIQSGTQLSTGPGFVITPEGIAELQKLSQRLQEKERANFSVPWGPEDIVPVLALNG